MTEDGTIEGALIGTPAYMSPEQARGKTVDKRTDIWAFGCVLYEMLTGRAAFSGDTVADTIAKVLEREPDWTALPPTTPDPIRNLLFGCLAKDSRERLRDIGDVAISIDSILSGSAGATAVPEARRAGEGPRAVGAVGRRRGARRSSLGCMALGISGRSRRRQSAGCRSSFPPIRRSTAAAARMR